MDDVRVTLYDAVLNPFLTETASSAALAGATRLRDDARRRAPKRTGAGAESIDVRLDHADPDGAAYVIGPSLKYMTYQEEGTGPVFARPGHVLRFQAGGTFVFARHTRGVPARHFMRDAYQALTVEDFKPGL